MGFWILLLSRFLLKTYGAVGVDDEIYPWMGHAPLQGMSYTRGLTYDIPVWTSGGSCSNGTFELFKTGAAQVPRCALHNFLQENKCKCTT